jgi:hypothetical protein
MKPELKELMEELQIAFNESVCESDRIAAVLADIKSVGYDVLLALEVTIGVTATKPDEVAEPAAVLARPAASGEFQLTDEDEQFLRGLKIGVS